MQHDDGLVGEISQVLPLERLAAEMRHRRLLAQTSCELALAGFQRRFGALSLGDVLPRSAHRDRRSIRAHDHFPAREHRPLDAVRPNQAVLERERASGRESILNQRLHAIAIVWVHGLKVCLEAVLPARVDAVDTTQFAGPVDRVVGDVPLPTADDRDPLRVGHLRFAAASAAGLRGHRHN